MEWFFSRNGQTQGPVTFEELVSAARDGRLAREDYVWRNGMQGWVLASSIAGLWGPVPPTPHTMPVASGPTRRTLGEARLAHSAASEFAISFRDPTRLTKSVTYLLYAHIATTIMAIWSDLLQLQLLADRTFSSTAAVANDSRQRVVAIVQLAVLAVTVVTFAVWIYRANFNARQLGATGMRFSPGWAVGWYFVPIAFLWKPYQAMKEIWKASKSPHDWQLVSRSQLLPWWWFFWASTCLLGNISFRTSLAARTIDSLTVATVISLLAAAVDVVCAFLAIRLVRDVHSMQMANARGELSQIAH